MNDGRAGSWKSTNSDVTFAINFECLNDRKFPLARRFDKSAPVVPKLAPRSLTRKTCPDFSLYAVLFSSFRSQLLINDIITRNPFSSRVPLNGLRFQRQTPAFSRSFTSLSNRAL